MPRVSTATSVLGYDEDLLANLAPQESEQLTTLSHAWLSSAALLGFPLGIAVWKVEHSTVLALGAALGTSVLVINLLRMLVAGGGTPLNKPVPGSYLPSAWPGVLVGALALLLSQPAQLLLHTGEADRAVAAHRQELLRSHAELTASAELTADAELVASGEQTKPDVFAARLAQCDFVVLRLKLLWSHPPRALLCSALYVLLVLAPFFLGRTSCLRGVQAYERERLYRAAALALQAELATTQAARETLAKWPSYRAGRRWSSQDQAPHRETAP